MQKMLKKIKKIIILYCILRMVNKILFLFVLLLPFSAAARHGQNCIDFFSADSVKGVNYLVENWLYHAGDDPVMATAGYDDSKWDSLNPTMRIEGKANDTFGIGWFRLHMIVDSSIIRRPLALEIAHYGASEIYFDGKKIASFGVINGKDRSIYYDPQDVPFLLIIPEAGEHLLSVRYANYNAQNNYRIFKSSFRGFYMVLGTADNFIKWERTQGIFNGCIYMLLLGIFIALAMSHIFIFINYKLIKSNLFFSIFCFLFAIGALSIYLSRVCHAPSIQLMNNYISVIIISGACFSLAGFTTELFSAKRLHFKIIAGLCILCLIIWEINLKIGIIAYLSLIGTVTGRSIVITIFAIYRKKKGAVTIGIGILFFTLFIFGCLVSGLIGKLNFDENTIEGIILSAIAAASILSIPVSMSLYLARNFAGINKDLNEQLQQVQVLSQKTIEQEQEKKQMLEHQKEDLEREVAMRTSEVIAQKQVIELKNKAITDNINYAQRIQSAILPDIKLIFKYLEHSFILFLPKDIVSGDFYTFSEKNDRVLVVAGDCTGHGVSGAMMSMIGGSLLNQIINEKGVTDPALVLNQLNSAVIDTFRQSENESNDGMDVSVCALDLKTNELEYAGANRPLWLFRNNKIEVIRPDKFPIGGLQMAKNRVFTNSKVQLQKNDTIYIFTDGYADQFGGDKGKKLMTGRFRELLSSIQHMDMKAQEVFLKDYFEQWKGSNEQVDDVLVIGIRV